ncbi:lysine/arginine/ornithine ABC transporter substrate-binding protein [Rhizobium sp. C1]|uniref:lysine/arginine/ornithine ABC transporter substrate-binding protein n=1 Tax=Rhizobium sp. C1 TaxID=1349799 RepID=UPI001E62CA55|nr:lysine/arginine/ornithine ABC transporter substrate-binding protein [Rhizobium sp. C1]MCD2177192.1 lysine/arginine/ornithine ABC transporter substrate-binding protein [Rhizobium sp. C1]
MAFSRKIATAAALALTLFAGASQAADKLVIGTDSTYPPFEYQDASGKFLGFEMDLGRAICAQMKVECTFVSQDFDGIIPALQAKKFDMIMSSLSITDERKKLVDFSDRIFNTPPAVAVPKNSPIKSAADLKGKTLGAQTSTTFANYAEKHMPDAQLKLYPTSEEYKLDMSSGRLDAVIDDAVVLGEWVKGKDGDCCKILERLPNDKQIIGEGMGIAVRKGDDALREKLNKAIAAIRADGTYKKIADQYFDFDVYGQ